MLTVLNCFREKKARSLEKCRKTSNPSPLAAFATLEEEACTELLPYLKYVQYANERNPPFKSLIPPISVFKTSHLFQVRAADVCRGV